MFILRIWQFESVQRVLTCYFRLATLGQGKLTHIDSVDTVNSKLLFWRRSLYVSMTTAARRSTWAKTTSLFFLKVSFPLGVWETARWASCTCATLAIACLCLTCTGGRIATPFFSVCQGWWPRIALDFISENTDISWLNFISHLSWRSLTLSGPWSLSGWPRLFPESSFPDRHCGNGLSSGQPFGQRLFLPVRLCGAVTAKHRHGAVVCLTQWSVKCQTQWLLNMMSDLVAS